MSEPILLGVTPVEISLTSQAPQIELVPQNPSIELAPSGKQGPAGENADEVQIEYSADGVSYHATYAETDEYMRFSVDGGSTWTSAIKFLGPQGDPGDPGNDGDPGTDAEALQINYSVDGSTLWHDTYAEGDMYVRFSTDGGGTWTDGMKFTGSDGLDGNTLLGGTVDPTTEGADGDWYIQRTSWHIWEKVTGSWTDRGLVKGADGDDGAGIPVGGTAGQIPEKIDGVDYNTRWRNAPVEATATNVASIIHSATDKTTPADADELPLTDSAISYGLKGLSWGNLKSAIKSYLDTYYGSGSVTKYSANVGDGSNTTITVTHSLGTRDVIVQVYDKSSPYEQVEVGVEHYDLNNVKLYFKTAPTTAQYRAVIIG